MERFDRRSEIDVEGSIFRHKSKTLKQLTAMLSARQLIDTAIAVRAFSNRVVYAVCSLGIEKCCGHPVMMWSESGVKNAEERIVNGYDSFTGRTYDCDSLMVFRDGDLETLKLLGMCPYSIHPLRESDQGEFKHWTAEADMLTNALYWLDHAGNDSYYAVAELFQHWFRVRALPPPVYFDYVPRMFRHFLFRFMDEEGFEPLGESENAHAVWGKYSEMLRVSGEHRFPFGVEESKEEEVPDSLDEDDEDAELASIEEERKRRIIPETPVCPGAPSRNPMKRSSRSRQGPWIRRQRPFCPVERCVPDSAGRQVFSTPEFREKAKESSRRLSFHDRSATSAGSGEGSGAGAGAGAGAGSSEAPKKKFRKRRSEVAMLNDRVEGLYPKPLDAKRARKSGPCPIFENSEDATGPLRAFHLRAALEPIYGMKCPHFVNARSFCRRCFIFGEECTDDSASSDSDCDASSDFSSPRRPKATVSKKPEPESEPEVRFLQAAPVAGSCWCDHQDSKFCLARDCEDCGDMFGVEFLGNRRARATASKKSVPQPFRQLATESARAPCPVAGPWVCEHNVKIEKVEECAQCSGEVEVISIADTDDESDSETEDIFADHLIHVREISHEHSCRDCRGGMTLNGRACAECSCTVCGMFKSFR